MAGLHRNCTIESDTFRRIEVITGVARRRRWPLSEKMRIVAESYAPGASATAVAVRHGLHRNQIFAWRRQLRHRLPHVRGAAVGFVPVAVAPVGATAVAGCGSSDRIEVVLGAVTIRVGAGFDAGDLRRALAIVQELA